MTAITVHGIEALDEAMAIMVRAFDPRYGEAWSTAQCTGVLSMPGAALLIARGEGVEGFAMVRTIAGEAELMLLAVLPEARGRGVGRALLKATLERARFAGAEHYFLEVRADNSAIALYASEGLTQVGVRRDYYRGNDGQRRDALTFKMSLI
jgi:[ribosomal protein S18]-alanine N-acetyltransferase